MKQAKIKLSALICSICLAMLFSCAKEEEQAKPNLQTSIQGNVKNGTWRITKFIDSGTDETNHFNGYNFTFKDGGVLNSNNGANDYNGTWSLSNSNSNDDSPTDLDFNINFNLTNDFLDLNDDWDIVSQSSVKLELIDISGGNGGTDYLTFEKN